MLRSICSRAVAYSKAAAILVLFSLDFLGWATTETEYAEHTATGILYTTDSALNPHILIDQDTGAQKLQNLEADLARFIELYPQELSTRRSEISPDSLRFYVALPHPLGCYAQKIKRCGFVYYTGDNHKTVWAYTAAAAPKMPISIIHYVYNLVYNSFDEILVIGDPDKNFAKIDKRSAFDASHPQGEIPYLRIPGGAIEKREFPMESASDQTYYQTGVESRIAYRMRERYRFDADRYGSAAISTVYVSQSDASGASQTQVGKYYKACFVPARDILDTRVKEILRYNDYAYYCDGFVHEILEKSRTREVYLNHQSAPDPCNPSQYMEEQYVVRPKERKL